MESLNSDHKIPIQKSPHYSIFILRISAFPYNFLSLCVTSKFNCFKNRAQRVKESLCLPFSLSTIMGYNLFVSQFFAHPNNLTFLSHILQPLIPSLSYYNRTISTIFCSSREIFLIRYEIGYSSFVIIRHA